MTRKRLTSLAHVTFFVAFICGSLFQPVKDIELIKNLALIEKHVFKYISQCQTWLL